VLRDILTGDLRGGEGPRKTRKAKFAPRSRALRCEGAKPFRDLKRTPVASRSRSIRPRAQSDNGGADVIGQGRPRTDHARQFATVLARDLCAYLCDLGCHYIANRLWRNALRISGVFFDSRHLHQFKRFSGQLLITFSNSGRFSVSGDPPRQSCHGPPNHNLFLISQPRRGYLKHNICSSCRNLKRHVTKILTFTYPNEMGVP